MKIMIYRSCILFLLFLLFNVLSFAQSQTNNSISGFVFAGRNQPLAQVSVELLDEYGRFVGRILTDNSGRYNFYRIAAGKYQIRVQASQYDLEEQVQDAEIINFSRQTSSGSTRTSGADSVQLNFYLKPMVYS